MINEDGVAGSWDEEEKAARLHLSKIGAVVGFVLILAGSLLDYFTYPEFFFQFLVIRVFTDLLVSLCFLAYFTRFGFKNVVFITNFWLILPQLAICYMIFATNGALSPYYAGLNLAILGMALLMRVNVFEVLVLTFFTTVFYLVACIENNVELFHLQNLVSNLYFILATGAISGFCVYFNNRRSYSEFCLRYEVSKHNSKLAEIDRAKSEFFANISHEFRTPLTLILAPLERVLRERENLPDQVANRLDLARSNGLRLSRLINDLLEIIRLEDTQVDIDCRLLRLDTLLANIVDGMAQLAEMRGIAFASRSLDEPLWVRGDRSALEKVFYNLLSNALKFTDEGGRVDVFTIVEPEKIRIEVQDTGVGMDKESLVHIFDRFRQGDNSTTRKYAGTGLGLALVKELTERHGGEVSVTSRLNEGTTISVSLPRVAHNELMPDEMREQADASYETPAWLDEGAERNVLAEPSSEADTHREIAEQSDRSTVLVIDDEPDMRNYMVDLLRDEYRVLVAKDGHEGLDIAQKSRPELLVLDLMLPEIDGLEVCRRIKQDPDLVVSRIVLVTARADEGSKLTALENGADDFLTKPFSGTEVKTRLRNLRRAVELEQSLYRRNDALENTIAELNTTRDKLIHSEKLNALGKLSAGLLHEINNPLSYTLTAIELAKNDPAVTEEEELRETLTDIGDGMRRIGDTVKELRAFAYPSKNDNTEFSLQAAIDSAEQILVHESRGVEVRNEVDRDWKVLGSRNHITQVLVNLLSNAVKAVRADGSMEEGEACITIRALREGDRLFVGVRDNGPGIGEDALKKIFDPFYTTKEIGEGMGMGLSVCQTIIGNHEGELVAHSEEGAWTEFIFDLALSEQPVEKDLPDKNKIMPDKIPSGSGGERSVS